VTVTGKHIRLTAQPQAAVTGVKYFVSPLYSYGGRERITLTDSGL